MLNRDAYKGILLTLNDEGFFEEQHRDGDDDRASAERRIRALKVYKQLIMTSGPLHNLMVKNVPDNVREAVKSREVSRALNTGNTGITKKTISATIEAGFADEEKFDNCD